MMFDHRCTISRASGADERPVDDFGQPIGTAPNALKVYDGACRVYDDEVTLKRMATGDESLVGWSAVRLPFRPQAAPMKGDTFTGHFNGTTRTGQIESISALAHYPRLKVRWL